MKMLMAVAAAAAISFSFQQRLLSSSATWNRSNVDYSSDHDATVDHPATGTDIITDWKQAHNQNQINNSKTKHTSRPLEMLQEYQQFHSQSILLEEHQNGGIGIHNRTFVLGLYACPDAAGNRLHEFFNNMIIAIAHNYTISWKFFDESTCRAVGTKQWRKWCRGGVNSLETCGEVVERASWVASYDEWSEKLNLTFGERSKLKEFYAPYPNDNKVWVPKERNIPVSLKEQGQIKEPMAIERMKELYSMGTYYLYGMLFHEIFPFHESVKPSADLVGVDEDEISIVLHSRHVKVRRVNVWMNIQYPAYPAATLTVATYVVYVSNHSLLSSLTHSLTSS